MTDCDYSLFVQLLQVSTGKRDSLECCPDEKQWAGICKLAAKQSLLGIIFDASMSLPEYQQPSKKPKLFLGFQSEVIQKRNVEMNFHTSEIVGKLQELGLKCCILKGQGVAELYPSPLLRQSGDIDVWVMGDPKDTLQSIGRIWKTSEVFYHHAGITPFEDGTEVEIHFRPSWMNNPSANRKLQRYFNSCTDFDTSGPFPKPSRSFDCIFSAIHIFRHLLFEGIGIRQLMDYHYILQDSTAEDRENAYTFLKSLKLERFMGALMYAEEFYFRLEENKMLCAPDSAHGEFLVEEVMKSGNFGTGDSRNRGNGNGTLLKRAVSRMSRLIHFAGIAPSEVFWAPAFKTWQYLRIRRRGYSITPTP